MPTSGQTSGLYSVHQIVIAAMQDLGLLRAGDVPEPEDAEMAMERLNWMLKDWQASGCNLWRDTQGELDFIAGQASQPVVPRALDIIEARVVLPGGSERPLSRWEPEEYRLTPNKAARGTPTCFMFDLGLNSGTLTLWPVPSAETTVRFTYARVIEDVTALSQSVDVPQEWTKAVWKNLAADCVNVFGATRVDPGAAAAVTAEAGALAEKLFDFDRPSSVFMGSARSRNRRI